jgi:hypothetical protein
VVYFASFIFVDFLNNALTAVSVAAAIAKELIVLVMFFANPVMLRNVVYSNFLVLPKDLVFLA